VYGDLVALFQHGLGPPFFLEHGGTCRFEAPISRLSAEVADSNVEDDMGLVPVDLRYLPGQIYRCTSVEFGREWVMGKRGPPSG
jgi:hypothetical protein